MKKVIKSRILAFMLGAILFGSIGVVSAYSILANDIGFTPKDETWKKADGSDITNVKDALDELYTKKINYNSLKTVSSRNISVEKDKIYLISVAVMSGTDQRFSPSITSGAEVLANSDVVISKSWSNMITYTQSFIVKSTDTSITISGNPEYQYQSITSYEIR